jgi:transposase
LKQQVIKEPVNFFLTVDKEHELRAFKMTAHFLIPSHRQSPMVMVPEIDDLLPKNHIARLVIEVLEQLDQSALISCCAQHALNEHHPCTLLGMVIYGFATGIYASRDIVRCTWDSVAFRFIAANAHPTEATLKLFRKCSSAQIEDLFVQFLAIVHLMKMPRFGAIELPGARNKNPAWPPYDAALESQLRQNVSALLALAQRSDQTQSPDGMWIKLSKREDLIIAIDEAKAILEQYSAQRGSSTRT